MIWVFLLAGVILLSIFYYNWSRRHLYFSAVKYDGPFALPLVGNAFKFLCKNQDILSKLNETFNKYPDIPFRFWLGPKLIIGFSKSAHVEKILTSNKFLYKHEVYDYLKPILGEGLITASGPAYKAHKRIIQPMFSLQYCKDNMDIFQKNINICMENLENLVDKGFFDANHVIHKCSVDIIGETILGYNIGAQKNDNQEYIQALIDMYDLGFTRLIKPWLHSEFIYNFTSLKKETDGVFALICSFMSQIMTKSWTRRKLEKKSSLKVKPIIDQIADHIEQYPNTMTNEDLRSHLITLYAASEDTIAIIASFACLCFGMYPEYQNRAAEEIREVLGTTPSEITYEDISKLSYLDMCLKDVLRLAPIGPYILRRTLEEAYIDKWYVPKDCAIVIPIFNMHRNPKYWDNPLHFHPDHFLPSAVDNRPSYVYLPFSAGSRGCIGKTFANLGLKMFLCNILQRFELFAEGTFEDVKLKMDISTRPISGYKIKIKHRNWLKI